MGAWGVKLNQNDLYADVRDFYTALLRYGMSDKEALTYTLCELAAYENDPEERELFWFSLADVMWKLGRLTDNVKCKALAMIDSSDELKKWYDISVSLGDSRKEVLKDLKIKLESDQPARKKFGKKRYKKCKWSNGDIFRYSFSGDVSEHYGMGDMYLFIQKIDDFFDRDTDLSIIKSVIGDDRSKGDIFPIIRFWVSKDPNFIPTLSSRNECIPTMGTKGVHSPKNYRFYILDLPSKCDAFEFICNSNIIVPDNEDVDFINENSITPKHLTWKFFDKHVIGRYLHWTQGIDIFRG